MNAETALEDRQVDKLVQALLLAQADFPTIRFDAANPHFRNRYATLAHIIAQTRPALGKHGLAVSQLVQVDAVVTLLLHSSGQFLASRTPIVSEKPGPQAMGSGITYARRYGLCAILGIAAEEDDDGESAQRREDPAPQREGRRVRDQQEAHEAGRPAKPAPRAATAPKPEPLILPTQGQLFWIRCGERAKEYADAGVSRDTIAREVLSVLGVESTKAIPAKSFDRALELVKRWEPGKASPDAECPF
jgi:hypothetical protein